MIYTTVRCDGCERDSQDDVEGWISIEKRGDLFSISKILYSASSYKHYCPKCAENGLKL